MNNNKHLLLWSSLAVLGLLAAAAAQEHFLKPWRRIQASVEADARPIDRRLRQIVVPNLKVTDRCVTCHVGMAPGEQGLSGHPLAAPHPPIPHDPAEFGCTTCHGGQGRATDKEDAHGDVHFWPTPMIPQRYAYAGCGSCHTHVRVPSESEMARGSRLLERLDCLACHRVDGRGGTMRPGGVGGMEGPDLSRYGASAHQDDWYASHLEQHQAGAAEWKDTFGPIEAAEREAIETFLASRVGAPALVEAKAQFHSLGCRGCHKIGGVGGDDGPDLTHIGQRDPGQLDFRHVPGEPTLANWLSEHTRNPAGVVPGSLMPRLGLPEEQVDWLTYYMLSLRRSELPEAYWPKDRILAQHFGEREFSTDGATLYGTFCAACHGPSGEGRRFPDSTPFPAIGNPDFLAAADDAFLEETIRRGRPGRRMPAWSEQQGGLRAEEIRRIVAHLRQQAGGIAEPAPIHADRRWIEADAEAGRRLYERHCAGCHGLEGEGPDAPALNHPALLAAARDDYLVATISRGRRETTMHGFAGPSPIHPTLWSAEIESIVSYLRTWEKEE